MKIVFVDQLETGDDYWYYVNLDVIHYRQKWPTQSTQLKKYYPAKLIYFKFQALEL